ncbi:MAG: hypothetical protein IPF38_19710 [Burkholderiales bacterium]|nr:hypothetical protein [Burkholderiales bacterium]
MKIKSQWFQTGTTKTAQQTSSAMAFIVWRVAQNMLKQMRTADFSTDVGPQPFRVHAGGFGVPDSRSGPYGVCAHGAKGAC